MIIEKQPSNTRYALCLDYYYSAAREAMKDFIASYVGLTSGKPVVFVPAYVGLSPKEGSGIFDPLVELSESGVVEYEFYRMDKRINIVFDDLERRIKSIEKNRPFIVLRVNYFGFQDPCSEKIFKLTEAHGGVVLEDDAHGFLTFQRQGCHWAHAAFFSLHKQFSFPSGGMLRVLDHELFSPDYSGKLCPQEGVNPWIYDMGPITKVCRENFKHLTELSFTHAEMWTPLRSIAGDDETVPQTFPILLNEADRFAVYTELNERGYGVTSLYHTMIENISFFQDYLESQYVSQRVLNLPVHQDVTTAQLDDLVEALVDACSRLK